MARLTPTRFQQAQPIFDRYRDELMRTQRIDPMRLEQELKELWGMGYQELKALMIDLSKRDGYTLLAARYMEHGYPSVVVEFQMSLAEIYGVSYFHDKKCDAMRKAFWERAFEKPAA